MKTQNFQSLVNTSNDIRKKRKKKNTQKGAMTDIERSKFGESVIIKSKQSTPRGEQDILSDSFYTCLNEHR